ncbi:hypothetical protein [Chitinophaga flava]|uniref:Uncharacterized protein n=1 Tax=Chitinophaga flava TaxID=2259036 RepID=A0A365Y5W3_9BACT|nr:hypothetical protein [Chitinophaga flava]RBL93394.1 hypothetical protein DF182_12825 [Chitinophaga flava]
MKPDHNLLNEIYSLFSIFSGDFREMVCSECNWSEPTFYRKMRNTDSTGSYKRLKSCLSKAEEEAILKQACVATEHLASLMKHYQQKQLSGLLHQHQHHHNIFMEEQEEIYFLSEITVPVLELPGWYE